MSKHPRIHFTNEEGRDEQAVLIYLSCYQALEQALVRAGFARPGNFPGVVLADWKKFALHIEGKFDPEETDGLKIAVDHLLQAEHNVDLHHKWLDRHFANESGIPHDMVWLAELLQHTQLTLIEALNFPKKQGYDRAQIMAALFVVENWSHLDAQVESMLAAGM